MARGDAVTEHMTMIEDCGAREDRLSDWERGFIDSLRRQLESGRGLTPRQAQTLDDLWERATARG